MIENLKVGDVVEKKCHFMEHQIEWGGDCYCCKKCGTVLKENTLVQPEKTLEEKFLEWRDTNGFSLPLDELKDLAQIAAKHYQSYKKRPVIYKRAK